MTTTGEVVAEHFLVAPGEASVRDEHYGGPRPDTPRRAVRPKTTAEKEFCALGPVAEAFITGAAAAGCTRLGTDLAELNTLRAAHGDEEFLAALDRGRLDGAERLDRPADAAPLRRQRPHPQRPRPPHLRPHHGPQPITPAMNAHGHLPPGMAFDRAGAD